MPPPFAKVLTNRLTALPIDRIDSFAVSYGVGTHVFIAEHLHIDFLASVLFALWHGIEKLMARISALEGGLTPERNPWTVDFHALRSASAPRAINAVSESFGGEEDTKGDDIFQHWAPQSS